MSSKTYFGILTSSLVHRRHLIEALHGIAWSFEMKKIVTVLLCLGTPLFAQDRTLGDIVKVDACDRHKIQMSEMMRGKGANSNQILEFASFIEISAHIEAYILYTDRNWTLSNALEFIIENCERQPTATISLILLRDKAIERATAIRDGLVDDENRE